MSNEPCLTCPWRLSSTVGGYDIPRFDIDKMRNLRCTVGEGDAFRQVMACHYSGDTACTMRPCVGYVYVEGYRNLNVRMMTLDGTIDFRAIDEACESIPLWSSFEEMLAAYEAAQ